MEIALLIKGEDRPALGGGTFDRKNPVTNEVVTTAPAAKKVDVDAAVAAADAAFADWSKTGPNARRTLLNKAADMLESMADEFVKTSIEEIGCTAPWAGFNVMFGAKILREAASMTTQIRGEVIPSDKPGCLAMAIKRPVGVLVGMAPWNAAVILGVRAVAMPIACGNTVVLKASEKCPRVHMLIGEAFRRAGFPDGVLNVVTHSPQDAPEVVEALITHPKTRRINFTGSTRVGRIVAEIAARELKPCLLELGGKAPLVVLDDADIDAAVNAAIFGAFMNQGQICMSTERIIVDERVADDFVAKFTERASQLPVGDPNGNVVIGSVVDYETIERVDKLVDASVALGARVTTGGKSNGSTIMPATVVDHVNETMPLFSDESFGPVVCVVRARDTEHAVEIANASSYGLSSAVFGSDINRAISVAERIEAGICHINGPTVSDEAQMPFGGMRDSGYGRFGGTAGIDAFTETRWITVEDPHQHYPF